MAPRNLQREFGELLREARIEQAGARRTAAMMHEAEDRCDAKPSQLLQPRVMPGPVAFQRVVRRDALPAHGVAQGTDTKGGDLLEILDAIVMPGLAELIAP